jgi:hypothetical protein
MFMYVVDNESCKIDNALLANQVDTHMYISGLSLELLSSLDVVT